MGVYFRIGKKGKITWYIDFLYKGKRIREAVGTNKKLAETVLSKRKLEIAEGRFLNKKKESKILFKDFADKFYHTHSLVNKKSFRSDRSRINILNSFFGEKQIGDISILDIEEFKKKKIETKNNGENVSNSTVNRDLAVLKTILNKAVEWGYIESSPAKNIKLLQEPSGRLRYLEKEEIKTLLENCHRHLKPIVIIALNTGMRRGEILNLKWVDIDIHKNNIRIMNTKNGETRHVPMNETVKKTLIAVKKNPVSPYIFCHKKGHKFGDIKTSFLLAVKKSGIKDFHFHDLRHTFASHLVMAGVDLNTVRELLGHKSMEMVLRYAHLSPDHKLKAVMNPRFESVTNPSHLTADSITQKTSSSEDIENIRVISSAPVAHKDRAAVS